MSLALHAKLILSEKLSTVTMELSHIASIAQSFSHLFAEAATANTVVQTKQNIKTDMFPTDIKTVHYYLWICRNTKYKDKIIQEWQ